MYVGSADDATAWQQKPNSISIEVFALFTQNVNALGWKRVQKRVLFSHCCKYQMFYQISQKTLNLSTFSTTLSTFLIQARPKSLHYRSISRHWPLFHALHITWNTFVSSPSNKNGFNFGFTFTLERLLLLITNERLCWSQNTKGKKGKTRTFGIGPRWSYCRTWLLLLCVLLQ